MARLTSISDTIVAIQAVKLLTFQPMINPVLICREHKCEGQNIFEIAADEFIIVSESCNHGRDAEMRRRAKSFAMKSEGKRLTQLDPKH